MNPSHTVAAALGAIWAKRQATILGGVTTLERILAGGARGLEETARADAQREAHKLAGSLGTFGFDEGSELARRLEHALEAVRPLDAEPLPRLCALVAALARSLPPAAAPLVVTEPSDERPLVLVVSEDQHLGERVTAAAESRGLRAAVIDTPGATVDACRHDRPAAVLIDVRGEAATEETMALVEAMAGHEPPIPALVLTAHAQFTDRVEVARRGASGFLDDALSAAELVDGIVRALHPGSDAATTVLAVDDDPSVLAALTAVLAHAGHRLVTLEDPLRFWDVLEETRPDLVLLDLDMPGVSGLELCRVVRQDSRWSALPVMFLTASAGPESVGAIFAAGADDYVAKPIVGPELSTRIANRMDRVALYRAMADTDPLTGLANRRKSQEVLERLVRMASRYHQPLSLGVVDLDRFKQVNDRHGHAVGDAVLRRLGELLRQAFRGEDVAARWGGEEFVVGTYGMSKHDLVARLAEVLEQFREERFAGAGGEFHVSFSAGVAEYGVDGADLDATYRAADEVLDAAKASGRDRVLPAGWRGVTASDPPDVAVVEDDEVTGRVLVSALEARGYTARWIKNGAVAAASLAELRPRVVLLDVALPGLSGMEVLRRLAEEGTLTRTRIIVVTGHDDEHQAVAAFELGACDHVIKPFKISVLLERVRRSLEA